MRATSLATHTGNMTHDENTPRPFTRSVANKMIGGVCAGTADYFGIDVNLVRVLTVIAIFLSAGTAILIYLAAWMLMPQG